MTDKDLGALVAILLGAGIPLRVGLMIAMALILGYFVYEHTNAKGTIIKIAIVSGIFFTFEVWITVTIFNNIHHPVVIPPIVTLLILGGLFLAGLSGGMYMAQNVDKIRRETRDMERVVIDEIKANGNGK